MRSSQQGAWRGRRALPRLLRLLLRLLLLQLLLLRGQLLLLLRLLLLLLRCRMLRRDHVFKLLPRHVNSVAQRLRGARRVGRHVRDAADAAPRRLLSPHGCQALYHADLEARCRQRLAHQLQGG